MLNTVGNTQQKIWLVSETSRAAKTVFLYFSIYFS